MNGKREPVDGKLPAVALIYSRAAQSGEPPAKAVSEAFGVHPRTAGTWIRRAKDGGLISAQEKKVNRDALAVARALGVTYSELYSAIMDHAEGSIRLTGQKSGRGGDR